MGKVREEGSAYSMKKLFHDEGIITIRVTIVGANSYLLEDLIEGDEESFLDERKYW